MHCSTCLYDTELPYCGKTTLWQNDDTDGTDPSGSVFHACVIVARVILVRVIVAAS